MISIPLIILSASIMISGTMPLLGGKKARGRMVRVGGGVMLFLSVLTMLTPDSAGLILLAAILGMLTGVFFFGKGDEPTDKEAMLYGFKSPREELKTYGDTIKGMIVFVVILIVICVGLITVLHIYR